MSRAEDIHSLAMSLARLEQSYGTDLMRIVAGSVYAPDRSRPRPTPTR